MTLGFSPCPNDTFIFYALLRKKIETAGYDFTPVIEDVESLNLRALRGDLDITKMSFAAFVHTEKYYTLLESGSALGRNCGPLLISKRKISTDEIPQCSIAMPGKLTTANFLFHTFFPRYGKISEMVFSEIEAAILNEVTDAGVIIHENRFTYEKKGLRKIADLGEMWEQKTKSPIPLGGIFIKNQFDASVRMIIDKLIHDSIVYAFNHPNEAIEYVKEYSREMDEAVMWQHIRLYVNEFTLRLNPEGLKAVSTFLSYARKMD